MANVFVTGATSFLGTATPSELIHNSYPSHGLTWPSDAVAQPGVSTCVARISVKAH